MSRPGVPIACTPDAVCDLLSVRAESLERRAGHMERNAHRTLPTIEPGIDPAVVAHAEAMRVRAAASELRKAIDEIRHRFGYG